MVRSLPIKPPPNESRWAAERLADAHQVFVRMSINLLVMYAFI